MLKKPFPKNMGQGGTRYNVGPLLQGQDAVAFSEHVAQALSHAFKQVAVEIGYKGDKR